MEIWTAARRALSPRSDASQPETAFSVDVPHAGKSLLFNAGISNIAEKLRIDVFLAASPIFCRRFARLLSRISIALRKRRKKSYRPVFLRLSPIRICLIRCIEF
jgi:hypothetical protein